MARNYDTILLSDLLDMRGQFGPTKDELESPKMWAFDDALIDTRFEIEVPMDQVFATLCGDGRVDENGLRYNRGYFAFGGSYMPILGEALANPETVLAKGLRLDTHAHERLRQRHKLNPLYRFVWHTDTHAAEDSIGCGLLKGRMAVLERIAGGEFGSFVVAGNQLGHTQLHMDNPLATQLQRNARLLLDSNYLNVPDTALRHVPDDVKGLMIEEVLVGHHKEKRWKVETEPLMRTRTSEIWPQFDGWEAFVTSVWAPAIEAQSWTQMTNPHVDEEHQQEIAQAHYNAMGLITVAGIATLGNTYLGAIIPARQ